MMVGVGVMVGGCGGGSTSGGCGGGDGGGGGGGGVMVGGVVGGCCGNGGGVGMSEYVHPGVHKAKVEECTTPRIGSRNVTPHR